MKKSTLGIIVALVALVAIVGVVLANRQSSSSTKQNTQANDSQAHDAAMKPGESEPKSNKQSANSNQIEIMNFAYNSASVTIKKGTTVTWTNKDSAKHTITPDQESEDFKASELLGQGKTYSFTFAKAGTYSYHCEPHPYMKATIVVTE